jgi:hypothetical protein
MNSYKQKLFTLSYLTYMFKINTILLLPQKSVTPSKRKRLCFYVVKTQKQPYPYKN